MAITPAGSQLLDRLANAIAPCCDRPGERSAGTPPNENCGGALRPGIPVAFEPFVETLRHPALMDLLAGIGAFADNARSARTVSGGTLHRIFG
jgi:hypothetical protein